MMKKLLAPFILLLLICIGFAGFAKSPQYTDLWSTPVSSDLVPVALVNLPDTSSDIEKSKYHADFSNNLDEISSSAYVAPPCIIGASCDDGNANTVNDVYDANCDCIGEPIAPTCDEVIISYEINGELRETGTAAITVNQTDSIELFANLSNYVVRDPSGNIVPNNKINNIEADQAGEYIVNSTYVASIPTQAPSVRYVSSEEPGTANNSSNAVDGSNTTIWHTQYTGAPLPYKHEIQLDMGSGSVLSGFRYAPRRDNNENGVIADYEIYVSNSFTDWGDAVTSGRFEYPNRDARTVPFPAKQGRYLRLLAKSSINGLNFASLAEFNGVRAVPTATASTARAGQPASYAVDGNNATFWHSNYVNDNTATPPPHYIQVDLGIESNVSGLDYRPRQDGFPNGRIENYEIYVSNSATDPGAAVAIGSWDYDSVLKTVNFPEKKGRYVRLSALAGRPSDPWASAAEVSIKRTVDVPCVKAITINVTPRTTYAYNNGTWSPEIPAVGPKRNDILIINEGDAQLDNSITFNKLIVNPGASLTIPSGVVITATSTTLKSQSDSFSSLIVNGDIIGIVKYERWVNQIGTSAGGGNDLISSPVKGATFNNAFRVANLSIIAENPDPAKKGEFAFAPYNVEVGAYENFNIGSDYSGEEPIVSGAGYRAATNAVGPQTGNTLTFTGSAATADVTIGISDAVAGRAWNLIGNPYPSYLDFETFFEANKDQSNEAYQAVYGYTGTSNDWNILNKAKGDGTLIAPGQGFFVKSKSGGAVVQFTPAMRRVGNSDDYIVGRPNNASKALSKLKLSTASTNVSTSIYFIEGTTKGLDPGYDAAAYAASKVDFSLFTNLLEDNSGLDIAIQSLPYNDFNGVIVPLGIQAKAGVELSISIDELSTLPSNINVYLEDTKNETLTLLNDGDFKFIPTTDVKVNGRFNVHYSAKTLSVEDLDANDNLRIYTTTSPRSLFIVGQLAKATNANLYDIQGRLVLSKTLNPNTTENTIDISTLGTGIYVVKVNNDNQIKTQKVIIK